MPLHRCSASAAFICEVPSRTDAHKTYTVQRGLDNHGYSSMALAWSCSCPDWEYRKNTDTPYECKHIQEVRTEPGRFGFCDWEGEALPNRRCPSCSAPTLPDHCFRSLPPLTVVEPEPRAVEMSVAGRVVKIGTERTTPMSSLAALQINATPPPAPLASPSLEAGAALVIAQWEKVPIEFAALAGYCLSQRVGHSNNYEQAGYDLLLCWEGLAAQNMDRLTQLERMFKTRGRLVGFKRTMLGQDRADEPSRAMMAITL